jgi:DeoR/GlpR family transcriptional regulator of sugar metabolism
MTKNLLSMCEFNTAGRSAGETKICEPSSRQTSDFPVLIFYIFYDQMIDICFHLDHKFITWPKIADSSGLVAHFFAETPMKHALLQKSSGSSRSMTAATRPFSGSYRPFDLIHDGSLPARRRSELISLARRQGQLAVTELASQFGVSPDTIRRDLDLLSLRGFLQRTHGGAIPTEDIVQKESPFAQRIGLRATQKTRIAQCAAELIQNGETLILNGGSTTRAFAFELGSKKNLTVITNALAIPSSLPEQAVRDIFVLGGEYRAESDVIVGPVAFSGSASITADSAILGVGGITKDGVSTRLLQEATMAARMIAAARRTVVLADSSKFNQNVFAHIAALTQIDILVTDEQPPADLSTALDERGVRVIVAPPLNFIHRPSNPNLEYASPRNGKTLAAHI